MPLKYARAARADLEYIVAYIALDNPPAAEKTYRRIAETVNRLADFPGQCRPCASP